MKSYELMQILIPEGKVKELAKLTNLTTSLLYQERRKSGDDLNNTGTRNTIDRLDLFCKWNLAHNPLAVRLLGERYLQMYQNHVAPLEKEVSVNDLLAQLGEVSRECCEAVAALAGRQNIKKCTVEVAQAKEALEIALAMVSRLDDCE